MAKAIRLLSIIAFLFLGTASVAQTTGNASDARTAFLSGRYAEAEEIVSQLLSQDPENTEGLLVRSALLLAMGQPQAARNAASRAYRNARSGRQRFEASMLAARGAISQEMYTSARFWLLRAEASADTERGRQETIRARQAVARIDPLNLRLRFSAAPSRNVNNGAEVTTLDIGGLPFVIDESGRQLSGHFASGAVALSYRIRSDETSRTELLSEIYVRNVWLSSEAKASAPGVESRDFDYLAFLAGLQHVVLYWPDLGPTQFRGLSGHERYGHRSYARWLEFQAAQTVNLDDRGLFRFGASVRSTKRFDDAVNDSVSVGFFGTFAPRADLSGREARYGAHLITVESDAATIDRLDFGISVARQLPKLGPMRPSISAGLETSDYRKWKVSRGGRRDNTAYLNLDLELPGRVAGAFSPVVSILTRRTWSNIDIYDRNELSLNFSLMSQW